jgi:hypothetical protein
MFDSVKRKNNFPVQRIDISSTFYFSLDITRGGIIITTVDHADIRGLVTA